MLDAPMRDAPFSVDLPLLDLLTSTAAVARIEQFQPSLIGSLPPMITATEIPCFSAIMTMRKLLEFRRVPDAEIERLNKILSELPVSPQDRADRCRRYDSERPDFSAASSKTTRVLLFEKVTGFCDPVSMAAARSAFQQIVDRNGWALDVTSSGGAMHSDVLSQFDVVVWNNVSGDVLTLSQRDAFQKYVENGGGFVGIHGSGGDPVYFWEWYRRELIGAQFVGHPMKPQFQEAVLRVEANSSGIGSGLPSAWSMNDEWYSFAESPQNYGAEIVLTLDERTYDTSSSNFGPDPIAMGKDHPIAWTRRVGDGRAFYSAIGHVPEVYRDENHLSLLTDALAWAAGIGCASHPSSEFEEVQL